jgi:peptidoglycan-associated lipoprotein
MKRTALVALTTAFSLALITGCASQKPALKAQVPAQKTAPVAQTDGTLDDAEAAARLARERAEPPVNVSPNLAVSSEIARACHLQAQRATPEFAFDSTDIVAEDKELLSMLAKCMAEGALRGKNVELTGRTDPRGEAEYNMSLGETRADAVRRYLHDLGVAAARLRATSRGELDANGSDETTWAHDRRVDIDLVN